MDDRAAAAFNQQAAFCDALRAPFMAALCRSAATAISPSSQTGQRLADWPGDLMTDAVPMRLTGALHWLVRAGRAPNLAAFYPPEAPAESGELVAALVDLIADPAADAAIAAFLASAPQTNEVGRAGALMPGLLVIAAACRLPLRLIELGASAGLNLNMDRFACDLGGRRAGDVESLVRIAPHWRGPMPPAAAITVVGRCGIDIAPLDVAEQAVADRLLAFIWADQPERLERAASAIALARRVPPQLIEADAGDWLATNLALANGAATVVYHSIAFQYFPQASQRQVIDRLEVVGAAASPKAPLAWLRMEMDDPANPGTPAIRLRLWRGGPAEERLLGHAHPHGAFVQWLD